MNERFMEIEGNSLLLKVCTVKGSLLAIIEQFEVTLSSLTTLVKVRGTGVERS